MSRSLPPHAESAQQPTTLAEKLRRNPRLAIIIAACVVVGIGLWLLVVFTRPEIKTPTGNLVITKVARMDSFPAGCSNSSPSCYKASAGRRILVVRIEGKDKGNINAPFETIGNEVFLVAENGAKIPVSVKQEEIEVVEGSVSVTTIVLLFGVEDSERNFKLMWPDNPPIELNPILYLLP